MGGFSVDLSEGKNKLLEKNKRKSQLGKISRKLLNICKKLIKKNFQKENFKI